MCVRSLRDELAIPAIPDGNGKRLSHSPPSRSISGARIGPSAGEAGIRSAGLVVLDDDARTVAISISIAVPVDDHRLISVGVMVPVFVDDDGLIAVAISIGMDCYASRPDANTDFVGENWRGAENAGRRKEYNRRTSHVCCSMVQ
jgi:hypothetical protein